jgi:hypothetical protein
VAAGDSDNQSRASALRIHGRVSLLFYFVTGNAHLKRASYNQFFLSNGLVG